MDRENIKSNIDAIRTKIAQDFMRLVLEPNWYNILVESEKELIDKGENIKLYKSISNNSLRYGLKEFDVDSLDISALNILLDIEKVCPRGASLKRIFQELVDDRNLKSHTFEKETIEDVYINYIGSLYHLREFILKIKYKNFLVEKCVFDDFKNRSLKRIRPYVLKLINECAEEIGVPNLMEDEIDSLKTLPKRMAGRKFIERYDEYLNLDRYKGNLFAKIASEKGIEVANGFAIQYYIDQEEYEEAENKLLYIYELTLENTGIYDIQDVVSFAERLYCDMKIKQSSVKLTKLDKLLDSLGYKILFKGNGNDLVCRIEKIEK